MQPVEYICVNRAIIDGLPTLAPDTLKVFLVILDRTIQQRGTKLGLSLNELARTADVGRIAARSALSFLAQEGYLALDKKGKHHVITVAEHWLGERATPIPFTYDDTDQSKIASAESEIRRLDAQYRRGVLGQRSDLADVLKGEERDLVVEIEGRRGVGLSTREAYFVGKAVSRFGPDRVKAAWRQLQGSKEPIRAVYAALQRGMKGKGAEPVNTDPFQKVKYRDL